MFTPTAMGTGVSGYEFLMRTRDRQQQLLAQSAPIARDTEQFKSKLKDIQTSDQLMDDRAMLRVALGAFGLDEDINNRAFIKKILDSDLTDGKSLANRLADKRYLAFAKAFNFAGEGGPSLTSTKSAEEVSAQLASIQTADDLLNDPSLLRATLKTFGLEDDRTNTYFLQQVLNSDLGDENSFANRLSDPRYVALAEAFDLAGKARDRDSLYGFATLFADKAADIRTPEALMDEPELLAAALQIFGLQADADDPELIEAVLASDLTDDTSVANTLEDKRYAALANVFDFAAMAEADADPNAEAFTSTLQKVVKTVSARTSQVETPADLFKDISLMLATFEFFDLPSRSDSVPFASRILESDRNSPTSLLNVYPDQRYRAFADAFNFKDQDAGRTYPAGFAETVVENYLDRQFEIEIGNADPTLRIALSLERDMAQVIAGASTNSSRWYGVLASKPLREVFETAFQLPASFSALDIDRQSAELQARSERLFGTSNVTELAETEALHDVRRRYLLLSNVSSGGAMSSASIVATLLGGSEEQ
ncbi:DUF1217 domain-containing protein [Puniceibacterium sp. HSS470]|nr:DUF1217 domain-containing protein [Puniceibacterium sp. HSS470]